MFQIKIRLFGLIFIRRFLPDHCLVLVGGQQYCSGAFHFHSRHVVRHVTWYRTLPPPTAMMPTLC